MLIPVRTVSALRSLPLSSIWVSVKLGFPKGPLKFSPVLFLHAVADGILEFNLVFGAGLFLAGHVCYLSFFSSLVPVAGVHLIVTLCLLGIVVFFFWRRRKPIGKNMPLMAVYGVVLAVTAGFAVSCLTAHTLQGQLIAIGGALFFISDAMLLGRLLFSATHAVDWAIMITYYAAQLLFGASCLL